MIFKLISVLIIMAGVVLIYDARPITKKAFSFGDQNEGAFGLKITGFILTVIGCLIIIFMQ